MRITHRPCYFLEFLLLSFLPHNLAPPCLILTLRNDPTRPNPKRHMEDIITFPGLDQISSFIRNVTLTFLTSLAFMYPFHVHFVFLLFRPVAKPCQQPWTCFLSTWKTLQWKTNLKLSASKTGRQAEMTRAVFVQRHPPAQQLIDAMNCNPG